MSHLAELYRTDFHAWSLQAAELVRTRRLAELNLEDLAEELESMGRKERNEVANRLVVLLAHLLKWEFQPTHRSSGWRGRINEQRKQILRQLKYSPTIHPYLAEAVEDAYPDAVELAVDDTGLPPATFPAQCPYSLDQLLERAFYPNAK